MMSGMSRITMPTMVSIDEAEARAIARLPV